MIQTSVSGLPPAAKGAAAVCLAMLALCGVAALAQSPGVPLAPPQPLLQTSFRAVSYDVYASLNPASQLLTARATVEFQADQPSRTVEFELHPNLRITAVRDPSGKMLSFDRDDSSPLDVRVLLSDPLPTGQKIKLTFDYAGPLANEEASPVTGVRLAWIGNAGAYLLLPARWFPLTGYPSNRYTGVFRIEVPKSFVVVGTGTTDGPAAPAPLTSTSLTAVQASSAAPSDLDAPKAPVLARKGTAAAAKNKNAGSQQAPTLQPLQPVMPLQTPFPVGDPATRSVYTFRVDRPEAAGTFVAGSLQLDPVQAEGVNVSVYAPPGAPADDSHGQVVARIVNEFSGQFGALAQPDFTLAQIPDGTLASFAAPGLMLLSQRDWTAMPNERVLANLVASQWWGDQVMPASPSDTWVTTGLASYSEALYLESADGKEGMNNALEDYAIGSLMFESTAPIAEAARLEPFTPEYDSVIADKGAMVFHMLRGQLGDSAFSSLLHDFYAQYAGKTATIADFENMAESRAAQIKPAGDEPEGVVLRPNADSGGAPLPASVPSDALNLRPFFAQWINSTGVPEFTLDYTIYRTKSGFKLVGKLKQNLDFFHMPVELEIETEGNPEYKTIQASGLETSFDLDVFGRPKPGGILLDPHDYILKSSDHLRVRALIARGEALAEQGRYYDAVREYDQALDLEKTNALATFRTGEAFFYQKNYSAAANAFRDTLDGDVDPTTKWVMVWAHIYLGKLYDLSGDRARAVNEYAKAEQTDDNTGGAQDEVKKYTAQPYSDSSAPAPAPSTASTPSTTPAPPPAISDTRPTLKRAPGSDSPVPAAPATPAAPAATPSAPAAPSAASTAPSAPATPATK